MDVSRFWRNAFIGKEEKSITSPKQNGGHVGQLCHYAAERARTEIVIDIPQFRLTEQAFFKSRVVAHGLFRSLTNESHEGLEATPFKESGPGFERSEAKPNEARNA